jgi:hypothetical protein
VELLGEIETLQMVLQPGQQHTTSSCFPTMEF